MRTERFRGALLSALMIAPLMVLAILLLSPSPVHAALTPHAPIYIKGNENFTPANGVVSGSGTAEDPYIIENWDISAENLGVRNGGIIIKNTTARFILRHVYVHDGIVSNSWGIHFENASNGKVDNVISDNNYSGVCLLGSNNFVITNSTLVNNRDGVGFFGGVSNIVVANSVILNNKGGHGIRLPTEFGSINGAIIENCIVGNNSIGIGHDGTTGGINNIVIKNTIVENSYSGIAFGSISYRAETATNNVIANSIIRNNGNIDIGGGDGITIDAYYSNNNVIENCYVENSVRGISLRSSPNSTIRNNTVLNNPGTYNSIYISMSENTVIENNTVENNWGSIYLRNSSNNRLRNNTLSNNTYNFNVWGGDVSHFYQDIDDSNTINGKPIYYIVGQENLTIDGNIIDIGFLGLVSSENIQVRNLSISNNANGILLANTSHSTITNSSFENNQYAIDLWGSSNNLIENCIVENNWEGIVFWQSSSNNVLNNCTATFNSSYGIHLGYSSENNIIYHNNLINNANQASGNGSNYWDDGYPSGGNYWSDYTGEDNYQGENQAVPGSDGIGDTPYGIPGGANQDHYPLMSLITGSYTEQVPPGTTMVDARDETDTTVSITTDNAGSVTAVKYKNNPGDPPPSGFTALGKYVEVRTDIPSDNIVWPIEIRIYYTDEEVAEVGAPENILRIFYWDGSDWVEEPDSGVDIENNYVWARVLHLSPFTPIGFIWNGTAVFSLVNLYTANIEKILDLYVGSKLVVKFYTYGDAFENENVIENFSTLPWHVEENESARHPENIGVKKVRLDLTCDDTENVISTIATFTVTRDVLAGRIVNIYLEWPFADADRRNELNSEIVAIYLQWPFAPP